MDEKGTDIEVRIMFSFYNMDREWKDREK